MTDLIVVTSWVSAHPGITLTILAVILLVKGLALYKAARKESIVWFWVILVFNTLGILPLLYLIFSRKA